MSLELIRETNQKKNENQKNKLKEKQLTDLLGKASYSLMLIKAIVANLEINEGYD